MKDWGKMEDKNEIKKLLGHDPAEPWRDVLIEEYKKYSTRQIGKRCKVSGAIILKWLKKEKIKVRPRGGNNRSVCHFKITEAHKHVDEFKTMTARECAMLLEVNEHYFRRIAKKFNFEFKRQKWSGNYGSRIAEN